MNDKNTRKGTAKKGCDDEYDDGICYIDASMTPCSSSSSLSFEKGRGGGGVSVYYSPGHRLNFTAAVVNPAAKIATARKCWRFSVHFEARLARKTDGVHGLQVRVESGGKFSKSIEEERIGIVVLGRGK